MPLLEMLGEEEIAEERLEKYFSNLYKVVCVSERPDSTNGQGSPIRTTYIVDWEQLVHLLEDYGGFGEDIVEVAPLAERDAAVIRSGPIPFGNIGLAHA